MTDGKKGGLGKVVGGVALAALIAKLLEERKKKKKLKDRLAKEMEGKPAEPARGREVS